MEAKVRGHDCSILEVPGWSALSDFGFPAHVARFAAMPDNEIAAVPWRAWVSILVKALFPFRPHAHVCVGEFPKSLELRRFEVGVYSSIVRVPVCDVPFC